MEDNDEEYEDVIILPADKSLLGKIGKKNLDKMLSREVLDVAEKVIADSVDHFYDRCIEQIDALQTSLTLAQSDPSRTENFLKKTAPIAFNLKTCSAQAGYDLVAALSNSLQRMCENVDHAETNAAFMKIVGWHIESIKDLLGAKTKGNGGDLGAAIVVELEKIRR